MKLQIIALLSLALAISACSGKKSPDEIINGKASLPEALNWEKAGYKVITSFIDKKDSTMSILYGNDLARKAFIATENKIAPNEMLALVTWKQKADENWFGANIPGTVKTIELIKTSDGKNGANSIAYKLYNGKEFTPSTDTANNQVRIKYIFSQQPSVMP
jgi:hypothetical protein